VVGFAAAFEPGSVRSSRVLALLRAANGRSFAYAAAAMLRTSLHAFNLIHFYPRSTRTATLYFL
jgi:hypothetical protein